MKGQFEVALFLADYFDGDIEEALKLCSTDYKAAIRAAKEELHEVGIDDSIIRKLRMTVEFVEFDSFNPSTAAGYFSVSITGSKRNVEEAIGKWEEAVGIQL